MSKIRNKIRSKIQKKYRKYCRYYRICECYYPESFTCREGGGEYCGKYRTLEVELLG